MARRQKKTQLAEVLDCDENGGTESHGKKGKGPAEHGVGGGNILEDNTAAYMGENGEKNDP